MVECEFQEAVASMEIQLVADAEPVVFDRLHADLQMPGNFLAGSVLGDQLQNAAFSRREILNLRLAEQQFLHAIRSLAAQVGQGCTEKTFSAAYFVQGTEYIVRSIVLEYVCLDPEVHRGIEHVFFLIHGQDNYRRGEVQSLKRPNHFQTVQAR